MSNITWIGLGQMGLPMAANLVKAGHNVTGVEVNPQQAALAAEKGVELTTDAAAAAANADFILTMLPTGDLVHRVLVEGGVLDAARPGTTVVDCSTTDVTEAKTMHELTAERGLQFLDAPVSGGISGATAGTLTIMAGGTAEAMTAARHVLESCGTNVLHVGDGGAGQTAKLVNNMILGVTLAATCEGVALAERLGMDPKILFDVVSRSSGDNWALRTWYPAPGVVDSAPSNRDFAPGFTTSLLVKDMGLALQAAKSVGGVTETSSLVYQLYVDHAAAGAAALDCSSLVTTMQPVLGQGNPSVDAR